MGNEVARPAFYALRSGGWRDYLTLLHPPYTLWHLSYAAMGAALAPRMHWSVLGWTVLAFFLAMGIGAHALDEAKGRPLQTRIPDRVLHVLAAWSILGACVIGVHVAIGTTWWLLVFIAFGAFVVVAYNLELFGGLIHTPLWFAATWGAFPALTGYFASARTIRARRSRSPRSASSRASCNSGSRSTSGLRGEPSATSRWRAPRRRRSSSSRSPCRSSRERCC